MRRRELLGEPGTVVTEVTLNNEFLMSSYHTASERALASVALDMFNGQDIQVLVGGLGLGYTASEVLASDRVGQVEVVELLPQVIDWLDKGLIPLADSLKGDSRLLVSQGDVYKHLLDPPKRRFDLILIDVDHSPEDQLDGDNHLFYMEAGLQRTRLHLTKDGVLGVWSYAECSPFSDALRQVFREVRIKSVIFNNTHINETATDWLFFARGQK
ncbi:spermidine synthase [candidate division KSB1 bacterium]|nr:spermidine synthase [candidate division KSB1 bacterium]